MPQSALTIHLITDTDPAIALPILKWSEAYNLALTHGWKPQGTQQPLNWTSRRQEADWQWQSTYTPAEGQLVTKPDAQALADALVRGLAQVDSKPEKRWLRQVIDVCRAGPFRIG